MSNTSLKLIIEGFIFASDKAISLERIISLFPENEAPEKEEVLVAIEELSKDYELRGIELNKVSSGYRFQVRQELTPWVSRLWEDKPARYTRALLETLALIVYRQPITRGEIEEIRGVAVSTNIIKTLQEREWIRVVGHRDVPGKPALYATTRDFLDYFNLQSLDQLPPLADIRDLDTIASELDPEQSAALIEAINEMKHAGAVDEAAVEDEESLPESPARDDAGVDVKTTIDPIDAALAEILASDTPEDKKTENNFDVELDDDSQFKTTVSRSEEDSEADLQNKSLNQKASALQKKTIDDFDDEAGVFFIADEEASHS